MNGDSSTSKRTQKPKLLDQVRNAIRVRHYSIRTEDVYVQWVRRYILFHDKRHPGEMGGNEIARFLSHLARNVSMKMRHRFK